MEQLFFYYILYPITVLPPQKNITINLHYLYESMIESLE